ncbi:hypothetical protein SAMN04488005_2683 [Yoonia tamlensis]|uniref:Uncharacterized protein n=1 Tax=Yoonia tamlensis TaxID=390270 RepID=A0A1I6HGS9_9RHOB|nr:hypothetical protein [Yoonia tamlensis]SFR53651.1 hypothetical protein SAMN04488005_2683 [Yoonia tamlensis]
MLSILSRSFMTATRNARWDAPDYWVRDDRFQKTSDCEPVKKDRRTLSCKVTAQ